MSTTPPASRDARPYHHGDLPRVLLDTATQAIAEAGPAAVSLRDLARRAGVSHAAPAHHFGDKAGLLSAVAADGFRRLAAARLHAAVGAWSLAAGLATFWLKGTRPPQLGDDPERVARQVADYLI